MNTTITIKTNNVLRDEAKKIAEEFVRERKFSVSASPMPTKEKIALWEKISNDIDQGKEVTGVFSDTSDLIKHLKKC